MPATTPSLEALTTWMRGFVGTRADSVSDEALPETPFEQLGIDSVEALMATMRLEDTFGLTLDPALFLRHATLGGVARELAGESA